MEQIAYLLYAEIYNILDGITITGFRNEKVKLCQILASLPPVGVGAKFHNTQ
jgi:hypothetical protein